MFSRTNRISVNMITPKNIHIPIDLQLFLASTHIFEWVVERQNNNSKHKKNVEEENKLQMNLIHAYINHRNRTWNISCENGNECAICMSNVVHAFGMRIGRHFTNQFAFKMYVLRRLALQMTYSSNEIFPFSRVSDKQFQLKTLSNGIENSLNI